MPMNHSIEDPRPPMQRLADVLVDGGLEKFVRDRRAKRRSWRLIERDLYLATNGQADVSFESLRKWYGEPEPEPQPQATPRRRKAGAA